MPSHLLIPTHKASGPQTAAHGGPQIRRTRLVRVGSRGQFLENPTRDGQAIRPASATLTGFQVTLHALKAHGIQVASHEKWQVGTDV